MPFYVVKTNPHQKGDYGGTDYRKTLVYSNIVIISKEDLRILVNKYLNIPFYALWKPSYEEPKYMADNIEIETIEEKSINITYNELKEKVNDRYYFKDFQLLEFTLEDDYRGTFPGNFRFTEITKENMLDIIKGIQEEKLSKMKIKEQECLKSEFKKFLNKLDKETILKMMLENNKEEKA